MSLLDETTDPAPADEVSPSSPPSDHQAKPSSPSEEKAWFDGISEDLVTDKIKRFGSLEDFTRSYNEAQKLISGKGLKAPGDDASTEEVDAFYKAIGRPDSVDGYKVTLPEDSLIDEDTLGVYKEAALKAGATTRQFQTMMDEVNASIANQLEADKAQAAERTREAEETLKGEWGSKYKDNIAAIKQTMNNLGISEATMDYMRETGVLSNVEFIKMLNTVTKSLGESNVSRGERLGDVNDQIKALKAARDSATDQLEYERLHQQYTDAVARRRGAI